MSKDMRGIPFNMRSPALVASVLLGAGLGTPAPGQDVGKRPARPAEETRLNVTTFREALKKRGLTEFLELHLRDFPPTGTLETLFALRDVKLVEMRDERRPRAERRAAASEANRILEDILRLGPEDIRRFEWYFNLAHSLVYDEAESYCTSILYRGGTTEDRAELLPLTTRALAALETLKAQLSAEFERIDALSVSSFEALERSGYVEQLDQLPARVDYLLLWTLLYDSLARDPADAIRATRLNRILDLLGENPLLLTTPHDQSKVQLQSMLLAGMTHRRLNNYSAARNEFDRALTLIGRLDDKQREEVLWAITLTHLESVRNDRDDARFEDARAGLERFRATLAGSEGESFGLRLIAALLERTVGRAQADHAERAGKPGEAARFRADAWKPLLVLLQRYPERRDEVYAAVYSMIPLDADPAALDPFDQCARIAGLLNRAAADSSQAPELLSRLVNDAVLFLTQRETAGSALTCEVLYNLAVSEYRRGRPASAARRFLQVVVECPTFHHALPAAVYAVQLAADLHQHAEPADAIAMQELYLKSLTGLIRAFPESEAARHWRFWYARLLQERGDFGQAAEEFARVDESHERAPEARFQSLVSLAQGLGTSPGDTAEEIMALRTKAAEFEKVYREYVARARSDSEKLGEADAAEALVRIAEARLLAAETALVPSVDRPAQAMESLAGLEGELTGRSELLSRLWRIRIVALQRLGRLDEAARAIPTYVAADPTGAGPTLQSLYLSLADEISRLENEGQQEAARGKAAAALVLARELDAWSQAQDADGAILNPRLVRVQLAEAHLNTGDYPRARELSLPLLPTEAQQLFSSGSDTAARALFVHSESINREGDPRAALPGFNRLAVGLPAEDALRWKALLRDLQCRTVLGQPPGDVLKVIAQQRHLHPALGGPAMKPHFERLERENQRR